MTSKPVILRILAATAVISLFATHSLLAWGPTGHKLINRLAAEYLPADLPAFLHTPEAIDTIEYLGPEPDRWRSPTEEELAQTQAPDHFIDFEYADLAEVPCAPTLPGCVDGKALPRKRYDFLRALNAAHAAHPNLPLTPETVGMQPWQVEEVWQRLKVDFRDYRALLAAHQDTLPVQTAILFDIGWLGHYVGDGAQPLHTTVQYNGWTGPNPNHYTTSRTFHSQFESVYVNANIRPSDVAPLVAASAPQIYSDEWISYLDYLRHTSALVDETYQLDKEGGFTGSGTPEAKAFTADRLAAGAIELRNMIDSAWVRSADAVVPHSSPE